MVDQRQTPVNVGLLLPPKLAPSMLAVLENLGRMMQGAVSLDLIQAGHDVPNRLRRYYRICQYPLLRVDRNGLRSSFRACYRYALQEQPTLLMNVSQPQSLGFFVAVVGRRLGIPSLVRLTGETFRQAALARNWIDRLKVGLLFDIMARFAYRYATRIVPVGPRLRDSLVSQGCPPEKVYTLPQPFDPQAFRPVDLRRKRELKRRFRLRPDAYVILYVGRLSWLKGADRLLSIITQMNREDLPYQFCIIGSGPYEAEFHLYPEDLVRCIGEVSRGAIPQYYKAADALVFPSRTEGLPNVVLEALATELPIMASPVGEIPYYVRRTATQPNEFVEWLLSGDWEPNSLPNSFEWEAQKARYVRLFEHLVAEGDSLG